MNYTYYEATAGCVTWCREQIEIHDSNIIIENMFVLVIAMTSLFVHNIIGEHQEWILKNTELNENTLRIIYEASSTFAFVLTAIFLIYYVLFQ